MITVDCISDLPGHYPHLPGGDLLIVAGDLSAHDHGGEHFEFLMWLKDQKYIRKIFIAGNHDNEWIDYVPHAPTFKHGMEYLCDSGTEFEGLKIWGSPWTLTFPGINPHCTAFTGTEAELEAKFALIPDDTDILITHGPPYGIMDAVHREVFCGGRGGWVGSASLLEKVFRIRPKLHVFGHIHEGYGRYNHTPREGSSENLGITPVTFVNCSHVNERYKPVNKPVRVVL